MDKWIHSPPILQRKVLLTLLLGIGSISIGAVMFYLSRDRTLLVLSILILLGCTFRSARLLQVILREDYDIIAGTCTNISAVPFRKYRKINLLDQAGNEIKLLLGKQQPVKPGSSYRFYFQRNGPAPSGNDYLDAMLSTNLFLGYEEWYPEISEK